MTQTAAHHNKFTRSYGCFASRPCAFTVGGDIIDTTSVVTEILIQSRIDLGIQRRFSEGPVRVGTFTTGIEMTSETYSQARSNLTAGQQGRDIMGEKHREMPFTPKGGWGHVSDNSEQAAARIKAIKNRHDRQVAKLADEGIIVGSRNPFQFRKQ